MGEELWVFSGLSRTRILKTTLTKESTKEEEEEDVIKGRYNINIVHYKILRDILRLLEWLKNEKGEMKELGILDLGDV